MPRRPNGKRSTAADGAVAVHGKAANGEGSVYFTEGRWRASYQLPGSAKRRTVSAATREKAVAKRAKRLDEADALLPSSPSLSRTLSVAELADWWLHNVHRHQVRESSWAKSDDRVRRIASTLGTVRVVDLHVEQVVRWQAKLLEELAPMTVSHHRRTLAQILDQAIELGLVAGNPVRRVKPPKIPPTSTRALSVEESGRIIAAAREDRFGAAVAMLFLQGWRVSEALGLAWEDVDLDAGVALIRRACIYVDHYGPALGPTKTPGAMGEHLLAPTVVELLRKRRAAQAQDHLAAGERWERHHHDGPEVHLVFTTTTGGLVLRQAVTKSLRLAAEKAGIDPTNLGTHTGRRSVVTALYAEAGESLEEIARYVGHASPSTTEGYVRNLGRRPAAFAERAAQLLDPSARATPP